MSSFLDFSRSKGINIDIMGKMVVGLGQCAFDTNIEISENFEWDTLLTSSVREFVGGSSLNTIRTLSYIGMKAKFISSLGDDEASHRILDCLLSEGINTDHVYIEEGASCSRAFILSSKENLEKTIFLKTENPCIPDGFLDDISLSGAAYIHFNGFHERALDEILEKIDGSRIKLSINCGVGPQQESVMRKLDRASIVVSSKTFCENFFLGSEADFSSFFFRESASAELLIVTHGGNGCWAYTANGGFFYQSEANVGFLNGVGAGDAFHAGILLGVMSDLGLSETLRIATWLGARCCETHAPVYFL